MALKLYGMPLSNYYNIVKAVMIEQQLEFEEVLVKPSQENTYLDKSPMGKVPCLETEQGFLTETAVILNYLDSLGKQPSFYPGDSFARAKVEELIHYLEIYLELPARRLYGEVFFGAPADPVLRQEVRKQLEKGFAALDRIAKYEPYLAGPEITYADFFFRFTVGLVTIVAGKALDWDAFNEMPEIKALLARMDERESIQRCLADQKKS